MRTAAQGAGDGSAAAAESRRRILRICTEEEAEIFWGDGEIPEELLFQDPPFFRDPDKGR